MSTRKRRRRPILDPTAAKKLALASSRKYWNQWHAKHKTNCVKQNSKKSRPSPPYSANQCCGRTMVGNDGQKYKSRPNVYGICSWIKLL
jgi:hypothetical protein